MAKKEYIEREAALQAVDCDNLHRGIVSALKENIEEIPVADVVKVRHGKWVWDKNGLDWGLGAWTCSECHRKPETWWEADKGNPYRCARSGYCNNCGAKMDGGMNDADD